MTKGGEEMTAQHEQEVEESAEPRCWCCGTTYSESDLLHLGDWHERGLLGRLLHWLDRHLP